MISDSSWKSPDKALDVRKGDGDPETTMNESQIYEGGCLCGAIRYRANGAPIGACHCHCGKCRRHSRAVFASAVGFPADDISWTTRFSKGLAEIAGGAFQAGSISTTIP